MPDDGHELIMPFVLVQSQGGPFDDAAFVAGMNCGVLDAELRVCQHLSSGAPASPAARYLATDILPQVDLIAMHYGYVTEQTQDEDQPEWTWVVFTPQDKDFLDP